MSPFCGHRGAGLPLWHQVAPRRSEPVCRGSMVSALRLLTSRLAAKADIPDRHVRGNRTHLALLAGTDFWRAEVLTLRGLVTHYVPFFIHLEKSRPGGHRRSITVHPENERVDAADGPKRDRGGMRRSPRLSLSSARSRPAKSHPVLPSDHCIRPGRARSCFPRACSPNLNAYAESAGSGIGEKGGVLVQGGISFGELPAASPERVCRTFPCRAEIHQGEGNVLLFPRGTNIRRGQLCSMPRATGRTFCVITIRRQA